MFKSFLYLEVLQTSRTTFNVIIPGTLFFCNAKSPQTFYIRRLLHIERQSGPFKTDKPDLLQSRELMQCIDENRCTCINQKVVEAETFNKIQWHYTNLNITTVESILKLPHILHDFYMLYSCDLLFRVFCLHSSAVQVKYSSNRLSSKLLFHRCLYNSSLFKFSTSHSYVSIEKGF